MDKEVLEASFRNTVNNAVELFLKKNAEYAGDVDALGNFKRNAKRNDQTVLECWMTYVNKHIDSVHTYMARVKNQAIVTALMNQHDYFVKEANAGRSSVPSAERFSADVERLLPDAMLIVDGKLSEPIEGRLDDIIVYCALCKAILEDLRRENTI